MCEMSILCSLCIFFLCVECKHCIHGDLAWCESGSKGEANGSKVGTLAENHGCGCLNFRFYRLFWTVLFVGNEKWLLHRLTCKVAEQSGKSIILRSPTFSNQQGPKNEGFTLASTFVNLIVEMPDIPKHKRFTRNNLMEFLSKLSAPLVQW